MPIFIDRHALSGATAAQVAEAHQRDLLVQDDYGVKFLTYWFDEARGLAFCLVDAPDQETAQRVHADAHGLVANAMIPVDLSAVEAFLGRISDAPEAPPAADADLAGSARRAVMFTDIVGSTAMTGRLGDAAAIELVRTHDALVRRQLVLHGGCEVKHLGDGIMASFRVTSAAVECAKGIQAGFERFNRDSARKLHVRIGIAAGEPIEDSCDLFGSTVQIASRLCRAARPDGVLVSGEVLRECEGVHSFAAAGRRRLKGFDEPVQTFRCS
jgi:class 3 adenylate cyclase